MKSKKRFSFTVDASDWKSLQEALVILAKGIQQKKRMPRRSVALGSLPNIFHHGYSSDFKFVYSASRVS